MSNSQYRNKRRGKRKKQFSDERRTSRHKDNNSLNDDQTFSGNSVEQTFGSRSKRWKNSQDGVAANSNAASTSTSDSGQAPEIPGFYYDAEKKKYFKILSSTNSVNVVTKEKIESDAAEKKRLKDISNLLSSSQSKSDNIKKSSRTLNLPHLLINSEHGRVTNVEIENQLLMHNVRTMKPCGSWSLVDTPDGISEPLEHMMLMDSNPDYDKLLSLWSVKDSMRQRLQLVYLTEKSRLYDHDYPLSVHVSATDTAVIQTSSKVSNVCWAPFPNSPSKHNVLYTTMCHTSYNFSLAFIRNLDRTRCEDDSCNFDYNLGCHVAWTCAWNHHKQRFSVGSEKKGMLIDVETRRLWEFRCVTDPFAQLFSPDNGEYLFSGGRNGMVLGNDLRCLSARPLTLDKHRTSVCALKMTSCGNYILSADISGKVLMWDIRMGRAVMEYPSLFNRYSRIPLQLDETEQVLYGAGQDCYTRFWSLKTGTLLKSLPPPCLASRETIPAVQYSTRWGNRSGNTGLIMGLGDQLYFYSGDV